MRSSNEIFDFYRETAIFTEDDYADFLVIAQDTNLPEDGAMAVTGLTLALLERDWNREKMLLLLRAFSCASSDMIRERIVVGLLLLSLKYNTIIRADLELQDIIQEVLTDEPELSFTALCNIARTVQVKYLEKFNQQMAKDIMPLMNQVGSDEFYDVIRKHQGEMERIARMHLDQNFLVFKTAYYTDFFRSKAANWFMPWTEEQLLNLPEDEREQLQEMINLWPMCDSDKYALCYMYKSFKSLIKSQLSVDSLREVDINMQNKTIVTNGYIQQLYRFFRLGGANMNSVIKPTGAGIFDLAPHMRDLLVYRLVVVGTQAQESINKLLV